LATATAHKQSKGDTSELERLNAEVKALREQLSQAHRLATVGTMAAMVAHEFNNILTPIINYARMARTDPSLVQKALTRAAEGGMKATDICNALLGLTRRDAGRTRRVSLARLVKRTLAAMAREPKKDGIELTIDVPAEIKVTTRPVELEQVLLNLLVNARSAVIEGNGRRGIAISARQADGEVEIVVADSGVGITPENLEKIFEPFFSTKPATRGSGEGRGLGLAFCCRAVTEMGGRICVRSKPGCGAQFTVHLPS
jgi:C4-dicarboxylate-specific signal transduction histidine kinase